MPEVPADAEMPLDPFGAPEELITMMRGIAQLHSAALSAGMPEHTATQFVTGVFCTLMANAQNAQDPAASGGETV
jgi:hypothetical protein